MSYLSDAMAKRAARLRKEAGLPDIPPQTLGDLEAASPLDFRNPEPSDLASQVEAARYKLRTEGREAFEGGQPAEACPYDAAEKPHARREWMKAYNDAAALAAKPEPEPEDDEPEDEGETE